VEDRRSDSETEALIADLAAHSADLSTMLHESVAALAELLATHPPGQGDRADGSAGPLPRDVLEIATLQAQAAGVSVEAYLRAAVLAYAGRPDLPAGEGEADDPERRRRARDEARRLRTESQAVKAQIEQAASRAARAKTDEDGGPPPKR
jgi:hypothetical protein